MTSRTALRQLKILEKIENIEREKKIKPRKDIIKEQLRKNKIFMETLDKTIKKSDVASLKLLRTGISQEIAKKMQKKKHKHQWEWNEAYGTSFCEICGVWDR